MDTTETNRYVSSEVPTFTQVPYKKLPVADWDVTPPTTSTIRIGSPGFVRVHVVVGAVLGPLMCCTVVALGLLLRKQLMSRSLTFPSSEVSDPVDIAQDEEDTCHVYDEIIMYSSNILPQEDSDLYCTIRLKYICDLDSLKSATPVRRRGDQNTPNSFGSHHSLHTCQQTSVCVLGTASPPSPDVLGSCRFQPCTRRLCCLVK
ncbi:hypothetical protein J4Q44_G00215320 [Coregonus suidteri]|uniref:Uncharacterized protein n=1 Tax=Coregonus suidteri TaxID=861788 RepID=A0AAN8LQJ3_9TELE